MAREISLWGKVTIPHVQFSINFRLSCQTKQNHFSKQPITQLIDNSTCGIVVTFPFIEISLNVTDCIFQFYKRRKYDEAQTERHILMLFYVSDLGPFFNLRHAIIIE